MKAIGDAQRVWERYVLLGALILLAACAPARKAPVTDLAWPLPPEEPRIKYLRTFCCTDDFGAKGREAFLEALFGAGGSLRMSKPYGITADQDGKIYVTDTGLRAVWIFDEKNAKVSFLGTGALRTPIGVAVSTDGKVFVSDAAGQRVNAFDRDGRLVMTIGQSGELGNPGGLGIDASSNRLYVANTKLHKIRVYEANDGKFLFDIGERGSEDGQFNFPTNVSVRSGKVYVSDTGNFRVQVFDLGGKFLRSFGKVGDSLGDFARPKGIGVDSEGHVYVVDAAFDNFQIFDDAGRLLLFVGSKGTQPGHFWIPAGLYVDEHDRVFVADQYNQRVQVFQYLREEAGGPPQGAR